MLILLLRQKSRYLLLDLMNNKESFLNIGRFFVVVQNDTNNFSLPLSPIKRVKIVFYMYDKKGQALFKYQRVSAVS